MKAGRRVLVLTNMWPTAEQPWRGIFVKEQVEALRRTGADWSFDVMTVEGGRSRLRYLTAVPRLRRAVRASYDLVHAHYGLTGPVALSQRRLPMVLTLWGSDVHIPWQRAVSRFAARRAAAVIAVSERMRSALGHEADIVPSGVDTTLFVPRSRQEARARLGIGDDRLVVVFPSHPENPVKDYPLFSAALEALPSSLRARVDVVPLTGIARADVPWLFAAADLLMLTSRAEGSPNVVREAMACDLPVVAVDVGDVRTVLAGVGASAVTARDARALAEAATPLLEHRTRSDGAAHIRAKGLDYDSVARRIIDIYTRVVELR